MNWAQIDETGRVVRSGSCNARDFNKQRLEPGCTMVECPDFVTAAQNWTMIGSDFQRGPDEPSALEFSNAAAAAAPLAEAQVDVAGQLVSSGTPAVPLRTR